MPKIYEFSEDELYVLKEILNSNEAWKVVDWHCDESTIDKAMEALGTLRSKLPSNTNSEIANFFNLS